MDPYRSDRNHTSLANGLRINPVKSLKSGLLNSAFRLQDRAMKRLLLSVLLSLACVAAATVLRISKVTLPLYLHGSDTDVEISFESVPIASSLSDPESMYSAIAKPYIPPSQGPWKPVDINVASLYKIAIAVQVPEEGKDTVVTIDASKASRPEDYPFTIDQVIDAVSTCVKIMTPPRPADEGGLKINIVRPKK